MTTFGSFELTSVENLPNVSVAFPGEHWSDGKALETIVPGELVVPTASGGKLYWQRAASGTLDPRAAIAMNCVQVPDLNPGSHYNEALSPNEIVNLSIAQHQYVHAYRSGAFHFTLIKPDSAYAPGDLIGWDHAATRPTGKAGTGSHKRGVIAANAWAEVVEWRPLPGDNTIGILTVKSLRGQF